MTIIEYENDVSAGIFKITCPVCQRTTTLSTKDYEVTIEGSELSSTGKIITIKQTNPKEDASPYQIDLKREHDSVNCDFVVQRAPVLVLGKNP